MSFSFGLSPLLLLACVLVAAGLSYWSYRQTVPPLQGWRRWLPMALRFVALTTILFLLFEPVLRNVTTRERSPVLALLVDDTQSLRVTGTDTTAGAAAETVRRVVSSARDVNGEVRLYAFSQTARPIDGDRPLDSLRYDGARTNLAAALQAVRDDLQDANLGSVALLSDGQYNAGRNPLYVAERYPVPIHTVTLGDTTGQRDVQIRRIATNDIAYVDSELPVRVALRSDQAGGESVTVRLTVDGQTQDAQEVELPSGTAELPVNLTYTPPEAGLKRLQVSVTEIDGEATVRNNTAAQSVRVLESKRRVLLLAGAPSPDVAAARRILQRDADTELTVRVAMQNGEYLGGALPEDLSEFDALVLAGYPSRAVSDADVRRVVTVIDDGRPVLFLLQKQTDLARLSSSLGDALPVVIDQRRSSTIEAQFNPVEARLGHPVYQIDEGEPLPWRRLPPLSYNESRWTPTPDARVLATLRVRDVAIDDPAMVVRRRAGQRSAAVLLWGTWRWANVPEDLAEARSLWPGLLSNLVRWVSAREDTRPVRVEPVEETFAGGEPVEFTGQVFDESMTPVEDAAVDVQITAPDGTQYPHSMEPTGNGQYVLDVGTLPQGTYSYRAEAQRDGTTLGSDQGRFSVGSLSVEYRETRADAPLMQQIATRSGGRVLPADSVAALSSLVASNPGFAPVSIQEERETELWRWAWFLVLILACLAAEWVLRKRFGLV